MSSPYYQDDSVTIYHGDSRELVADLRFDAIVTDPPYGIALDTQSRYEWLDDHLPIAGDDAPFDPAWLLALEVPMLLWGANHYASRLPDMKGWIAWDKVTRNGLDLKHAQVEFGWTNFLSRPQMFRHMWQGGYRDSERGTRYHPAQKPLALTQWCLSLLPSHCQRLVDPYMGAGSTLVAAKSWGLSAIGIELEEAYCEVAAQRCSQEVLALI